MGSSNSRLNTRKNRVRAKIARTSCLPRLSVFKSGRHIYAQVICNTGSASSYTVAAASTLDSSIVAKSKYKCTVDCAKQVGKMIGELAAAKNIVAITFDRGGYKYHGAIKALADAAREKLKF